ncbi:MAG: protein-export chaperone SecB [Gammaproteobacteria bacterium]|nr:protein-export chaperone SecB [Gammaproteobacteria bacterium]MYB37733.1 protein-export chaperone SecB [Gammaproteobacteria bacterium]
MAEDAPGPGLAIERIYLKDASFESPRAPAVFRSEWQPQIHIDINTKNNGLGEDRHEVVLALTLTAKVDGESLLIIELQQAGIFRITGLTDDPLRQALAVACPNILFPYAREAIDSLASRGTFPAFNLAPINFDALYAEAKRRHEAEISGGTDPSDAGERFVN